jgi:hypothetical protein
MCVNIFMIGIQIDFVANFDALHRYILCLCRCRPSARSGTVGIDILQAPAVGATSVMPAPAALKIFWMPDRKNGECRTHLRPGRAQPKGQGSC